MSDILQIADWLQMSTDQDAAFLVSVIGVLVTAVVPVVLYIVGRKVQAASSALQKATAALQTSQENLAKASRRDELVRALPTLRPGLHLELLKNEMAQFKNTSDELLLAQALHSNISVPFPTLGSRYFNPVVVTEIIANLDKRFDDPLLSDPYPGLKEFIVDCVSASRDQPRDFPAFAGDFATFLAADNLQTCKLTHTWVRGLITEGGWALAAPLLHKLERMPSATAGGAKFNIMVGVFLAIIDAHTGRTALHGQAGPPDKDELHSAVRLELAFLLHRNNFNNYGHWHQSGATEAWTAGMAWLIQSVGIVARDDEHQEMRCIESLKHPLKSLAGGAPIVWGRDTEAVLKGFRMIQEKCPALWSQHGTMLIRVSGIH